MNAIVAQVSFAATGFVVVIGIDMFLSGRVIEAALCAAWSGLSTSLGIYSLVSALRTK